MREIKFRVWDRLCKRYWYKGFNVTPDGQVIRLSENIQDARLQAGWTIEKSYTEECYLDLEQFTGLTDKNGKEIFDGDIVIKYFENPKGTPQELRILVKIPDFYSDWFGLEGEYLVIGDIHTNPELKES